jgi:hypothetical protein
MNGHCSQSLLPTRTTCCPSGVRGGFTGGLEALELRIVRKHIRQKICHYMKFWHHLLFDLYLSTHLIVLSARDVDSEETIQDTNHHVKDLAYT